MLMLSRHRVKLTPTKFNKRYITGMVCSPNKGLNSKKPKHYIEAKCDDSFLVIPEDIRNGALKILCPVDCQKSEAKVFGSGKFELRSSMCRAAQYLGLMKDKFATFIEVDHNEVNTDIGVQEPSLENQVQTIEVKDPNQKFFKVKPVDIATMCPNQS